MTTIRKYVKACPAETVNVGTAETLENVYPDLESTRYQLVPSRLPRRDHFAGAVVSE
jgi:hypothetical protein